MINVIILQKGFCSRYCVKAGANGDAEEKGGIEMKENENEKLLTSQQLK